MIIVSRYSVLFYIYASFWNNSIVEKGDLLKYHLFSYILIYCPYIHQLLNLVENIENRTHDSSLLTYIVLTISLKSTP